MPGALLIALLASAFRRLASIGAGVGLGMSIATGYLLRWLRWRGAKPAVEITVILAVAYMSFYVGQSPAQAREAVGMAATPKHCPDCDSGVQIMALLLTPHI